MPATMPTRTPWSVVRITGCSPLAGGAEGADVATPLASSRSAVCFNPSNPWSTAWLEAVVQASQPMLAIHGAIWGGAAKTGKLCSGSPGPANGTSS